MLRDFDQNVTDAIPMKDFEFLTDIFRISTEIHEI